MYAIGVLLLWVMCFAANQVAHDPQFFENREAYYNASISHYRLRTSTFNFTYSEFGYNYTNTTFAYYFDRRCLDFFVVSSSFFTVSFVFMNITAINLVRPRIAWMFCMLSCYGLNIAGHLSFSKENIDKWLTVAASLIGFFWSFIVVSVLNSRICDFSICF